jgi:hypothetical protein
MPSAGELTQIVGQSQGFAGGLNLRDSINQVAPDELRAAENIVLDQRGGADKRLGCMSHGTFGASGDRTLSCYTYYRAPLAPQVLIHTTAGKLYYTDDAGANPQVWTEIVSGLSTSVPMSFETFNGKVYMSNGVDDYSHWNGTARVTLPSAPKGRFLRIWKDTMWVSGITGTPDRTYSSAPGDPETFPVTAWIDLGKGDGDSATALGADGTYLIFFKRNRHWVMYDPVTFANRVADYEKGCESHFSVVTFESSIFFLSRRGICRFLGDTPAEIISGKVDPLFDPQVLNLAALANVFAYTVGNQVGWSLPEVSNNLPTIQLEYYPRLAQRGGPGPFVIHRMPCSAFTRVRVGATERLFGSHNNSNKLLHCFAGVGTDDGQMFTAIMETGPNDFGAPTRTKYIRRLRVLGRGLPVVQFKRNFESGVYKSFPLNLASSLDVWSTDDDWGDGDWGPQSILGEYLLHPDAYGRFFQIRVTDSSDDLGHKLLPVGSREYSVLAGDWGIYGLFFDATILGVRD